MEFSFYQCRRYFESGSIGRCLQSPAKNLTVQGGRASRTWKVSERNISRSEAVQQAMNNGDDVLFERRADVGDPWPCKKSQQTMPRSCLLRISTRRIPTKQT